MNRELKIGDRVHTTRWNRHKCYDTGDTGTVTRTVKTHDGGLPFYSVAMDKDVAPNAGVLFTPDEIEADVGRSKTETEHAAIRKG